MCGEGSALATDVTRCACPRRVLHKAELRHAFYVLPVLQKIAISAYKLHCSSRSCKPFLASSEVSKCSPMHVDWQTMEIRPVGTILWSLLRKFPFASLPRPTHLRTPPTLYCFTNQLVTGQWRPQPYFFCCFGVHDLRNSWRFKEASPPRRAVLSQSRLDHPCILFPIPHSFIYRDFVHVS
jgi:hypothetical protein